MIEPQHVGRTYPATAPYEVSRAKIAEFASAIKDPNLAYTSLDPIAPPTFAAVIAAQAWDSIFNDPELGLALKRIVHAEQGFTYVRPLRAGDQVRATLSITKVRNRGPIDWVSIAVDLHVGDELVCQATSTFVHTRESDNAVA